MKIDVWYGDSDSNPTGPISGLLIEHNPNGLSKIEITDRVWLDNMGFDSSYFYTCKHLPDDHYVSYDDYAWSYLGECILNNKWW